MRTILLPVLLLLMMGVSSCTKEKLADPTDMLVNYIRTDGRVATNTYAKHDLTIAAKKLTDGILLVVYGKNDRLEFRVSNVSTGLNGIYTIKNNSGSGDVSVFYRYAHSADGFGIETDRSTDQDKVEGVFIINNYNAAQNTLSCSFSVNIKDTKDPRVRNADPVSDNSHITINGTVENLRLN